MPKGTLVQVQEPYEQQITWERKNLKRAPCSQ